MKVYRLRCENKKTGEIQYSEWTKDVGIIAKAVKLGNKDKKNKEYFYYIDDMEI